MKQIVMKTCHYYIHLESKWIMIITIDVIQSWTHTFGRSKPQLMKNKILARFNDCWCLYRFTHMWQMAAWKINSKYIITHTIPAWIPPRKRYPATFGASHEYRACVLSKHEHWTHFLNHWSVSELYVNFESHPTCLGLGCPPNNSVRTWFIQWEMCLWAHLLKLWRQQTNNTFIYDVVLIV